MDYHYKKYVVALWATTLEEATVKVPFHRYKKVLL